MVNRNEHSYIITDINLDLIRNQFSDNFTIRDAKCIDLEPFADVKAHCKYTFCLRRMDGVRLTTGILHRTQTILIDLCALSKLFNFVLFRSLDRISYYGVSHTRNHRIDFYHRHGDHYRNTASSSKLRVLYF